MEASEAILAAVAKLDMLELTSRIIINPERYAPRASVAEIYALARATEGLWAVAIEAKLLVSALDQTFWPNLGAILDFSPDRRAELGPLLQRDLEQLDAIMRQLAVLRDQLAFMPAPIPTTKQETSDGSNH